MRVAGACSGISAPAVAWEPLGWEWMFESEIEPFPSAVMHHHRPDVPNRGDMTKYREWPDATIDLLIGGTPCQSFSVAGLRQGLDDPRGNLALTFIGLVDRYRPRWVVWENVPGVLSSSGGSDFGSFIDGMAEIGYFGAWRVLDAQWFGVAQRRRRVFAVFCPGDWRPAAAVLFEPESLRGDSAPSREAGEGITPSVGRSLKASGGFKQDETHETYIPEICGAPSDGAHHGGGLTDRTPTPDGFCPSVANPLTARMHKGINTTLDEGQTPIVEGGHFDCAHTLRAEHDASEIGKGDAAPCVFSIMPQNSGKDYKARKVDVAQPVMAGGPVGGNQGGNQGGDYVMGVTVHGTDKTATAASMTDVAGSLRTKPPGSVENSSTTAALHNHAVRRLTTTECERLQGFPDGYTDIPWRGKKNSPDGPRYKALGNSMAVPVVRWIGERIQLWEESCH